MSELTKKLLRYRFDEVPLCNMCRRESSKNKVIGLRLNSSQGLMPGSKTGTAVTVVRCSECGFVCSSPLPVPFNIQDHYGISADDYWTPECFVKNKSHFKNEIIKAKELLGFSSGVTVLSIGAGIGKGMVALSSSGFDVEGFEPSEIFRENSIERMEVNS